MRTFDEQKAFFDSHWEALQQAAREGGSAALLAKIDALEDPLERRVLLLFIRQGLVMSEWEGKSLDLTAEVGVGSIQRLMDESNQAAADGDEETAHRRKSLANVISYNLAADLADCWPGERPPLTKAHFEMGLKAAQDCIAWREELGGSPDVLSMAWWAQGMHQLSLGRAQDAAASFDSSLAFAEEAAEAPTDFGVLLGRGYAGLAHWVAGSPEGRDRLREALAAFGEQLADEKTQDDARFGIEQLETVKVRYGPSA